MITGVLSEVKPHGSLPKNNILHATSLNSRALVVPLFCIPLRKIIASNRIL